MQEKSKAPMKAKGKGRTWKQKAPERVVGQPEVFMESEATVGERTSAESLPKTSARPKRGKKAATEPNDEPVTVTAKGAQSRKFQGWSKILRTLAAATSLDHMRQLTVGLLGTTPEMP